MKRAADLFAAVNAGALVGVVCSTVILALQHVGLDPFVVLCFALTLLSGALIGWAIAMLHERRPAPCGLIGCRYAHSRPDDLPMPYASWSAWNRAGRAAMRERPADPPPVRTPPASPPRA